MTTRVQVSLIRRHNTKIRGKATNLPYEVHFFVGYLTFINTEENTRYRGSSLAREFAWRENLVEETKRYYHDVVGIHYDHVDEIEVIYLGFQDTFFYKDNVND